MTKQYFYLVVLNYNESTYPQKIFLQEHDAIIWGRRQATKKLKETGDSNYEYVLYRQEITRNGELEYCTKLAPFENRDSSIKSLEPLKPFDWGQYKDIPMGSDYDIDKERI